MRKVSWLLAVGIAAYFLYFAHGAVRAHFAIDDPMNLGQYWRRGLAANLADVVMLWRNSYRPMGAAFYLPIYNLFGMNPLPYRLAVMAILAANVFLSFEIARRLTQSLAAATLTAVLVCAHASMTTIYYNTSMIYDILAFFFTALMLWIHVRWRGNPVAGVAVVLLFLAAINSKEIAVVGAVWVAAYELLFWRPWKIRGGTETSDVLPLLTPGVPPDLTEPRRSGRGASPIWVVPVSVLLIAAAFTAARALGPDSLSKQEGYRLEITAHRFFINARIYLNDLFYTERFSTSRRVVIVWALTAILCVIVRKRELWWAWFVASTAMLPVIFTIQPRSGGSLYLPLLAVALWMATAATALFERWPIRQWAAVALVALLMVPDTLHYWNERAEWMLRGQDLTWTVLTQIRDLPARPAHGSKVLFEQNPFRDWDTWFIANLLWNDHTLDIELLNHLDKPEDPERYQWVLTFVGDRLKVIKGPGS